MTIETELTRHDEVVSWVDDTLRNLSLTVEDRVMLAAGSLDVTIEHAAGIGLLCRGELYGPAFALLRAQYEAMVRGIWFANCATDAQVQKFMRGNLNLKMFEYVDDVEKILQSGLLKKFQKSSWGGLNGFAHTGMHQITRRFKGDVMESNFEPDDVTAAIKCSGVFTLLAGLHITHLCNRPDLQSLYKDRIRDYAKSDEKTLVNSSVV